MSIILKNGTRDPFSAGRRDAPGRGTHFRRDGGTRVPFDPRDAGRKIGFGTRPETSLPRNA